MPSEDLTNQGLLSPVQLGLKESKIQIFPYLGRKGKFVREKKIIKINGFLILTKDS